MGDEYLIGYRLATYNSTLISDRLSVSKSMTPCQGEKGSALFLSHKPNASLQAILETNENEFIEFATQESVKLQSRQNISIHGHASTDSMTLPTRCYVVDFNDDSVTISLLK
jgi:hypothetical protein